MLSIEVCKKYLGEKGKQMTDEEIEETRDALYQVGNILVKEYVGGQNQ